MKTNKNRMKNKRSAPGRQKLIKQGIHVKGSWKAVELDPSLFSDEGMGGLVCFEELTDYRLVDHTKVGSKEDKKDKKKAKKRKASEDDDNDEGEEEHLEEESEAVEPAADESGKPAKKKRKKKKKKKPSTEREDVSADGEEKKEVPEQDPCPEVTLDEGGGEEDVSEEKSQDPEEKSQDPEEKSQDPGTNDEPQSVTKKKQKKKRKRKNKGASGEATDPDSQAETVPQTDDGALAEGQAAVDKVTKLPKKKAKNWTNAALSGSADQQADVSAWKDLFVPAPVLQALSSLGFSSPTPIQALALPPAIRDRMDIVGAAETGSGKTLSFGIPMIHLILEWKKGPQDQDEAEDQNETTTKVESLYLPDEAPEMEAEANASIDTDAATETTPEDGGDTSVEVPAASTTEQDQESEMEDGTEEATQDDTVGSDDNSVDDDINEDEDLVEEDDEQLGCVKVIENVEFDFDTAAEAEEQPSSQNQPLLGLVLTPTRELAVQVKHHIDAVAKFTGIKTAIIVGGMAQQKQKRVLKRRPEIIIATPGRLWELIKEKEPHLQNLRQLRCLVIDEADRMVERGHFAELESLMEMLNTHQFNPKRQTFVFSATLTMVHSLPTRVLQKKKKAIDQRSKLEILMEKVGIKTKPKVIDLTRKEATVASLTETQIHCDKEEKDFFLYYFLLQYPGRTMVFANSIDCIKRLNCLLVILDHTPLPLHANMHQKQRLKNLERFAERDNCVLLTTDVAARGLDVPNVQHVIHYQVPRTSETYVHRSGRTARATKEGLSLLLIGPDDMMNFKKIYKTLGKDEDLPLFPVQSKCMTAIKERVNLARKIEKIEFFNKREKQHNSWFKQAADALDVDLDDDVLLGQWKDEEDDRQQQKMVKGMKKHLKHLLSQPVFKHEVKTRYPTQMGKLSLPKMPLAGMETAITSVSIQRKNRKQKKKQKQQEQL